MSKADETGPEAGGQAAEGGASTANAVETAKAESKAEAKPVEEKAAEPSKPETVRNEPAKPAKNEEPVESGRICLVWERLSISDADRLSAAMAEKFRNDLQARITEDVLMAEIERLSAAETPGLIEEISQDFTAVLSGS